MRYVAAYLLAVLGGNDSPNSKDLKKILDSVGIETDDERVNKAKACKLQMPSPKSSPSNNNYPSMKQDGAGFVIQHSKTFPFPKGGTDERLKRPKLAFYTQPVIAASVISELNGKNIEDVIAQGNSKLASMPAGGAVAVSSGGSAAPAGGPAPAAAEEKKEEKKEESEESDDDMGFGLFD